MSKVSVLVARLVSRLEPVANVSDLRPKQTTGLNAVLPNCHHCLVALANTTLKLNGHLA